jgi:hypothetical protein
MLTCPVQLILLDLITLLMFGEDINDNVSRYAVFSRFLLFFPLRFRYLPVRPFFRHLLHSVPVAFLCREILIVCMWFETVICYTRSCAQTTRNSIECAECQLLADNPAVCSVTHAYSVVILRLSLTESQKSCWGGNFLLSCLPVNEVGLFIWRLSNCM